MIFWLKHENKKLDALAEAQAAQLGQTRKDAEDIAVTGNAPERFRYML